MEVPFRTQLISLAWLHSTRVWRVLARALCCAGPNSDRICCQIKPVRILVWHGPVCRILENFGERCRDEAEHSPDRWGCMGMREWGILCDRVGKREESEPQATDGVVAHPSRTLPARTKGQTCFLVVGPA